MALKFGPQWLRDLTDDGTGSAQPPTPSFGVGVKFKLADYRYGREEMLALYCDTYSPPDQVRKHQVIFSKENQRPISMTPLSEDEQRLMSQGINSHVVLRGGRGGGVADRGRGRGRGRGDGGYVPRQSENGEQLFGRQPSNDGWEVVGKKPERSFSRGFDEPVPTKREFLRSSSNNWRDKKLEAEEEESNNTGGSSAGTGAGGGGVWRQNRENTRWGSARPNWRQPTAEYDESRPYKSKDPDSAPRGPRKTSDSYDNEVPEWAVDDVGDDQGTFDSKGIFVSTRKGSRDNHNHDIQKSSIEGHNIRKKHDGINETEHNNHDKSKSMNEKPKVIPKAREEYLDDVQNYKVPPKTESVNKPAVLDYLPNSMKGDGDSIHTGLMYTEKNTNGPQAPIGPVGGVQDRLYHPQAQPSENIHNRLEAANEMAHPGRGSPMANAENENLLRMEKSLQNLLAGMTANVDTKAEEEVDVSKGALPLTHKDANKWFYRDPQGKIQGPFTSENMADWFRIGYFTMNLIVKRGCDDSFKELGELIKQYGRVPFVPGPPLPPLITNTSIPEEIPPVPVEIPAATPPLVMTMPSMVNPMMPGMMGPTMPSLHDRLMFRSMMLQQEYLKQQLLMQQLQMQTMAKLQEQESFKDYTPDQQHDIVMRMMMQTNPLLMQQMQQLQHQQVLLQQQQQQQLQQTELHQGNLGLDGGAGPPESFQHPMSLPSMSMPNMSTAVPTPIPSATVHNSHPGGEQETGAPVWANNSQHAENSIWSQPSQMWNVDNMNEKSQAYKIHFENMKREREEEKLKEEERIKQELMESKQEELRKQQNELQRQREQMRREKEELEKERIRKLEEVRKEEQRIAQLENARQKKEQMEQQMRSQEEKKKHEEEKKKRDQENKKQEEKRRKEEEKIKEQKRKEEARRARELEEIRRQQEKEAAEARQREEMQRQLELQQIQEEEERIKRENEEKEKQQAFKKQLENQKHQESLRKLQQAQKEQLANMQLPASSNWAKHGSQGSVGHSKSLTEIQGEEARREKERQKEQQAVKHRMQEQAAILQQQQQSQSQKSWASQVSRGVSNRGPSLLDIQQQEKENAKKAEKERGKAQNHQAKPGLGSTATRPGNAGLWGTNSTWESSVVTPAAPAPVSTGGIWDMGVPQSVKKPQQGKNGLAASSIPGLQSQQQQQQSKKETKTNKKAAPAKQKEVETVQKLFHTKKQDGFTAWVTDRLSRFSSVIDIPTFVSFIVEVDSPHDVLDYVKTYLGDTKETQDFSRQFLEKRNQCKNQMRLQKQLEEDSIWGPAPAINPHTTAITTTTSSDSSKAGNKDAGQASKSKNKKKKKAAAQKLDASILGFTVTADPNRRNASGEFETID